MDEPKTCPFCGVKPERKVWIDKMLRDPKPEIYFEHPENGCFLEGFELHEWCIESWNRREGITGGTEHG